MQVGHCRAASTRGIIVGSAARAGRMRQSPRRIHANVDVRAMHGQAVTVPWNPLALLTKSGQRVNERDKRTAVAAACETRSNVDLGEELPSLSACGRTKQ